MKAFINNTLSELPDHVAYDGRILIRVTKACRREPQILQRTRGQKLWRLLKERRSLIPLVLYHDGPVALIQKTMHMLRREQAEYSSQYSSFVGRVEIDHSDARLAPGTRVAGIALTHPSVTELVLTRPELVWPISDHVPEDLAALVLYGGLCLSAVMQAQENSPGRIGLCDGDFLSRLILGLLVDLDQPFSLADEAGALWHHVPHHHREKVHLVDGTTGIKTWITTTRRHKEIRPTTSHNVIGVMCSIGDITKEWPNAYHRNTLDLDGMMHDPSRILDLFYDDGPCQYPDWFPIDHFPRYLQIITANPHIITKVGSDILATTTTPASPRTHATLIRRNKRLDHGFVFFAFPYRQHNPRRLPFKVRRHQKRHHMQKGVSLIGGNHMGLGMVAREILRHKAVALRGICDRRPEVAQLATRALPFAYATTALSDILEDAHTDAVLISTFHGSHGPLATAVLNAGKHCYVDKPLVINDDQLKHLAHAAITSGKILHTGYNRRFAPATEMLMRHLKRSAEPVTMNFVMRSIDIDPNNWNYWGSNGNRIISNVSHLIDFALHVLEPVLPFRVSVTTSKWGRFDENVLVNIEFADGSLANIVFTNRGQVRDRYFQRYLFMKGDLIAEIDGYKSLKVIRTSKKIAHWQGPEDIGHRRQMATFARAVVADGPAPVSLYSTLVSAKTILAASQAAQSGQPVALTFDEFAGAK